MNQPRRRPRSFREALLEGAWVADGAMGTELLARGQPLTVCYEELNRARPELVRAIHQDFLAAGADVVGTNTFGANALRLARHGLEDDVRAINRAGVAVARAACLAWDDGSAYVAGAIGPSGLDLTDVDARRLAEVTAAYRVQAEALAEGGVDVIVLETMRQPAELLLAVAAVRQAVGGSLPVIAEMSVDPALTLSDGTSVEAMGERLAATGVEAIGVNCSTGPREVGAAVERLVPLGLPLAAAPNAGLPRRDGARLVYESTPETFAVFAQRMFELGVRLVGGCCGTTPAHVRGIAQAARARVRTA